MDSNNFQNVIRQEMKKIAEQTGTSINDVNNEFLILNRNNAFNKSVDNISSKKIINNGNLDINNKV